MAPFGRVRIRFETHNGIASKNLSTTPRGYSKDPLLLVVRIICSVLATAAGAACLVGAALIWVPAPVEYIEIQSVKLSEHSLWLTLLSAATLGATVFAARLVRLVVPFVPALVLGTTAFGVSLIPPIQASQLGAQDEARLDPVRTLRPGNVPEVAHVTVTYATVDGQQLAADVFRPTGGSVLAPAVIAVHGGGWDSGKRSDYLPWHEWLATQGFVVFAIDYRLRPQPNWPAAAVDVQHAVDWVQHNAENFGADPDRLALLGRSAGGHLALLAAYAQGGPGELSAIGRPVQAVVALYAPTDLAWEFDHPANERVYDVRASLTALLGGDPGAVPERYTEASPVTYVRPNSRLPATLLVQGGRDQLVPAAEMNLLADRLRQAGQPVQAVEIPYAQHAFDLPIEGWSSQLLEGLLLRFFSETLQAP